MGQVLSEVSKGNQWGFPKLHFFSAFSQICHANIVVEGRRKVCSKVRKTSYSNVLEEKKWDARFQAVVHLCLDLENNLNFIGEYFWSKFIYVWPWYNKNKFKSLGPWEAELMGINMLYTYINSYTLLGQVSFFKG